MRKFVTLVLLTSFALAGSFEEAAKQFIAYSGDNNKIFKLFENSCESDKNGAACFLAATMLERDMLDFDKKPKPERGIELFQKSCQLGDFDGCYATGNFYTYAYEDDGKHYVKALAFFEKACDGNVSAACLQVANYHDSGIGGLKQDSVKAMTFYKKSCELENAEGCFAVGAIYEASLNATENKKAIEFYGLACDYGLDNGCAKFRALSKK